MDEDAAATETAEPEEETSAAEPQLEQPAQPPAGPAPADAQRIDVEIGEDGEGSAFVGLDVDRVALWNPPSDCSVGVVPAHTIGISKVIVSGAEPGSTVSVTILPK